MPQASPQSGASQLQQLDLSGCTLDATGLAALGKLPELQHLYLSSSSVDAAGFAQVGKLRQLRHLDLTEGCRSVVNATALVEIGNLAQLQHNLRCCPGMNAATGHFDDAIPRPTRFAASSTFFTQKRFDHTGGGTEVQCPGSGVSCRSAGPQFPTRAAGTPPPLLPMTGILSSYGDGKLSLSPLALDIAAFFGATADAALLIRHGADVNATRDRPLPETPLQVAVQSGHAETVKLLIDSGADFHTKMKLHSTRLHLAVAGGHAAVVKLLLEHGADPTTVNDFDCSPLHSAAHGRDAIAKLLIDCGANVNVRMTNDNHRGWTPLHKAARGGLPSTIKLFVDSGADIHARDASSRTPLHIAAQYDYSLDNARALIDHGADVNAVCESKRTPLHHTNEKVARVLLAAGADASAKAEDARTPLHDAVVRGDATLAEIFAQSGVDVNAVDKESTTPLHLAVEQGHAHIIDVLLAHGADVNARGKNDRTPLHVAVGKGRHAIAKVLLENGADANIVAGGQTPLNLAVRRKKLTKLLIRHGARVDTTP